MGHQIRERSGFRYCPPGARVSAIALPPKQTRFRHLAKVRKISFLQSFGNARLWGRGEFAEV